MGRFKVKPMERRKMWHCKIGNNLESNLNPFYLSGLLIQNREVFKKCMSLARERAIKSGIIDKKLEFFVLWQSKRTIYDLKGFYKQ